MRTATAARYSSGRRLPFIGAASVIAATCLIGVPAGSAQTATGAASQGDAANAVPAAPADAAAAAKPADPKTEKQQREAELAALNRTMQVSAERQAQLAKEIDALDKDRASLNAELIKTGDRLASLEKAVEESAGKLTKIQADEDRIRGSLNERRGELSEVLAALERIGRHPPPALVVAPSDARQAVRSAILLGAVLPQIRVEADALAADLAALARLEKDAADERQRLEADAARLGEERTKLSLLIEEKRKAQEQSAGELAAEKDHAAALAAQASGLEDLIGRLERDLKSARNAAAEARASDGKTARPSARDPSRLSPATPFASTKGHLRLPARGAITVKFGADDEFGNKVQGDTLAAAAGAQVTAPADGWVVYAGPFRSYGQILILNMGDGYHVLLAGLGRIDVDLGQFVLAGEPVGTIGGTMLAKAGGTDAGQPQSTLYIEFRKNGTPIDPTPWWAASADEEVRG